MAFSTESGAVTAAPSAPKSYNGGAVTAVAGNNNVAINIAQSSMGVPVGSSNGIYRISRANIASGSVQAYAVIGTVPAVYNGTGSAPFYNATTYSDTSAQNGQQYSYTVALDNNG